MKNVVSFVLLLLIVPVLFLSSYLGSVLVGCGIAAVFLIINAGIMLTSEEYEPPRCETCGQLIEEGGDMYLEDGFEDADR